MGWAARTSSWKGQCLIVSGDAFESPAKSVPAVQVRASRPGAGAWAVPGAGPVGGWGEAGEGGVSRGAGFGSADAPQAEEGPAGGATFGSAAPCRTAVGDSLHLNKVGLAAAHELHVLGQLLRVPAVHKGHAEDGALLLGAQQVDALRRAVGAA
eukprot:6063732-Prymnesium_polylepis.1